MAHDFFVSGSSGDRGREGMFAQKLPRQEKGLKVDLAMEKNGTVNYTRLKVAVLVVDVWNVRTWKERE